MVDALRAAHRALRPNGILVDLRPDGSRDPRVIVHGRVSGHVRPHEEVAADDQAADAAVATVVREGSFRPTRHGHLWHSTTFADVRAFREYLADSPRYRTYVTSSGRLPHGARILMRRAIKFTVFDRVP